MKCIAPRRKRPEKQSFSRDRRRPSMVLRGACRQHRASSLPGKKPAGPGMHMLTGVSTHSEPSQQH